MTEDECTKEILARREAKTYDAIMIGWYVLTSAACWVVIVPGLLGLESSPGSDKYLLRAIVAAVLLHRFSQLRVRAQEAYSRNGEQVVKLESALSKHSSKPAAAQ